MRRIILLIIALFLFGVYETQQFFDQPSSFALKSIDIPSNSSLKSITTLLQNEGVLQHRWPFLLMTRISGSARKLRSGEFMFHQPSSPKHALETLVRGIPVLHKVVVPEGSTIAEMAPWFEEAKVISSQEFLTSTRSSQFLEMFQIPSDRMEGYLFPSTYLFPKNENVKIIFQTMVEELRKNLDPIDLAKATSLGWNLHQWITFASIIEKETSIPEEYPLVSSVFHNRLKKKMRLQSDPTVIYGIENYDGNIRKKDLLTETPYNTYTRYGLPVGPISNPGAAAIHFAVNPAQTDYLYFVANKQGTHTFTKTYQEHEKAVRAFLKR